MALLIAGLNELEVLLTNIENAYLTASTTEKCYVLVTGEIFGPEQNSRVLKNCENTLLFELCRGIIPCTPGINLTKCFQVHCL